jgi:CDGSH-type Zn-finger protein
MPTPTHSRPPVSPSRARIDTIENLREHLQWAIELEHSTLPPYLCALYSLDPGRNREAVEVVTSVFLEEMLHLTLAANLLNAVGGRPVLDAPQLMPGYPTNLPHGDRSFEVSLVPFGREALELFLRIERPSPPGAPAESDGYETIGQFYEAIELGLRELCVRLGEATVFSGDPSRQVTGDLAYGGAGRIVVVDGLTTALEALAEIVEQGEGTAHQEVWDGDHDMFHTEREEVAHFYRFQELALGRRYRRGDTPDTGPTGDPVQVDWAGVRPMQRNPRTADRAPGNPIRVAQEEFNHAYCALLHLLEQAFNGSPRLLGVATGSMYGLKAQAQALMRMPIEDGATTAGPTFEYVDPSERRWSTGDARRIVVLPDGPYVVYGQVPLGRKVKVVSPEHDDSLTWQRTESITTEETYALCRCGRSRSKPFCDGSHARTGFDGTETAKTGSYASRMWRSEGTGISVRRVGSLCMHAAFCVGSTKQLDEWLPDTGDTDRRAHVMGMIEHCPSGSYTYAIAPDDEANEPDLPQGISVIEEEHRLASGLWVTGEVPIQRADGLPWEDRNRVMLCRCGQSGNKPLCDGTHRSIGFRE